MDLWSAIFTVVRRWYISVPVVIVSIVAMVVIGGQMQPDYESKASVVFNPPPRTVINGVEQSFKNQWASDPKTLAAAVYRQLNSTDEQKRLKDEGFSTKYTITLDQFSALMDIKATGKNQDAAINTAAQLIKEAEQTTRNIQKQGTPPANEYVVVNTVSQPVDAQLVPGSKTRVMATILLLGLVGAASAAFMVESLANRRRLLREGGGAMPMPPVPPPYPYAPYAALPSTGYLSPGQMPPGYGYVPLMPAPGTTDQRDADVGSQRASGSGAQTSELEDVDAEAHALDSLLEEVSVAEEVLATRPARAADGRPINQGRSAEERERAPRPRGRRKRAAAWDDEEDPEEAGRASGASDTAVAPLTQPVDERAEMLPEAEITEAEAPVGWVDESAVEVAADAREAVQADVEIPAPAERPSFIDQDNWSDDEDWGDREGWDDQEDWSDDALFSESRHDDQAESATDELVVLGPGTAQTDPDNDVDVTNDVELETENGILADGDVDTGSDAVDDELAGGVHERVDGDDDRVVDDDHHPDAADPQAEDAGVDEAPVTDAPVTRAKGRRTDDNDADGGRSGSVRNGGARGGSRKATTRNGGNGRAAARRARRSLFTAPGAQGASDAPEEEPAPLTSETPTPHGD